MSNPLVIQGTLNRLRGSVVYGAFPQLNVTSQYLAREGISLAFDGDTSLLIGTMTGAVTSPEPYTYGTATLHLLRSQSLANVYKTQIELLSVVGPVRIITDSYTLKDFFLTNCVLQSLQEMTFDGNQAGMIVRLRGIYNVNLSLYAVS
jgi:hypothetical protein